MSSFETVDEFVIAAIKDRIKELWSGGGALFSAPAYTHHFSGPGGLAQMLQRYQDVTPLIVVSRLEESYLSETRMNVPAKRVDRNATVRIAIVNQQRWDDDTRFLLINKAREIIINRLGGAVLWTETAGMTQPNIDAPPEGVLVDMVLLGNCVPMDTPEFCAYVLTLTVRIRQRREAAP